MAAYTTIDNPELYFQVKTYTGNGTAIGSGGQAITLDGDENMQPDFVWIKERNNSTNHQLYDSVRGATKRIYSDGNYVEDTQTEGLTAFGSDGFTVGSDGSTNGSSDTYVAWCWKESADAGFDIISYTGDGSDRDLSHSLSASPEFILIKQRTGTQDWSTQSTALGLGNYLILNGTNASASTSGALVDAVSSSTISVDDNGYVNASSNTYIGYLWRSVQGYSKFGSFVATGQSGTNGEFIYLGFKARWFMWKNTSTGHSSFDHWNLVDTKRQPYNGNTADGFMWMDAENAETGFSGNGLTVLANGVQISTGGRYHGNSGDTYIYMAFAEAPFVNSKGVPANAR